MTSTVQQAIYRRHARTSTPPDSFLPLTLTHEGADTKSFDVALRIRATGHALHANVNDGVDPRNTWLLAGTFTPDGVTFENTPHHGRHVLTVALQPHLLDLTTVTSLLTLATAGAATRCATLRAEDDLDYAHEWDVLGRRAALYAHAYGLPDRATRTFALTVIGSGFEGTPAQLRDAVHGASTPPPRPPASATQL